MFGMAAAGLNLTHCGPAPAGLSPHHGCPRSASTTIIAIVLNQVLPEDI